ncbi:hypothetical protein ASPACDRAFT_45661 [Aspergillus aculeatus ATCC 16872]|uniref:Uncharacterized protein n=1 Tax=Aspergillus aculeatus (strain ATCC 16872 / CBS 172.66 / WB 5094) TaxID=690307 RepID=A0A1L9WN66_ASPA1|nr:uncharacterized protein ASPACDRAFT_45661 [Aspergillus aculeatus ATCC 16872]OJJ97570.1 hypothetical protein ASPACDRAFT_45661 [Aspergillus aculeatus ATCC 16872]
MACHCLREIARFRNGDPRAEAQRLHQLDEDDPRLDGKDIVLFVQPAVLAFGSVHGEHYDQSKVRAAANVLVNDRTAHTKHEQPTKFSRSIKAKGLEEADRFSKAGRSINPEKPIWMKRPSSVESSGHFEKRPDRKNDDDDNDDDDDEDPMVLDTK